MGVSTKAILNKGITINKIVEKLETLGCYNIRHYSNSNTEHSYIDFEINSELEDMDVENRSMHVVLGANLNYDEHGFEYTDGIHISLSNWGCSEYIIEQLCLEFGGYYDFNDCDEHDYVMLSSDKLLIDYRTPYEKMVNELQFKLGINKTKEVLEIMDKYKIIE